MAQGEQPNGGAKFAPIDLASVTAFRIGDIAVDPPALILSTPRWAIRLEPRVMQVLVALAQAEGAVVSRETLNRRCWGGVVVSSEALTRAVFALRRAVAEAPVTSFAVETVPRVGYRLRVPSGDPGAISRSLVQAVPAAEAGEVTEIALPPPDQPLAAATAPRKLWPVAGWGIAAISAVAFAAFGISRLGERQTDVGRWRLIDREAVLADEPRMSSAALSPDGRFVAFVRAAAADEPGPLVLRALGGSGSARTLAPATLTPEAPAFSPSGDRVAFSFAGADKIGRIGIASVAGGPTRVYTTGRVFDATAVDWLPDGRTLLLSLPDPASTPMVVARLDLASGRLATVTTPPVGWFGDWFPVLSPGGAHLAFFREKTPAVGDWSVRDLPGGHEHALHWPRTDDDSIMRWLPGGTGLLYASGSADGVELGTWPLAGGAPTPLLLTEGRLRSLSLDSRDHALVLVGQPPPSTLRVAGATEATIAGPRERMRHPALAGDGALAVIVDRRGGDRLWLGLPGQSPRVLKLEANSLFHPRWSPDNRLLAVGGQDATGLLALVLDRAGRVVRRVHLPTQSRNGASWVENGRALLIPVFGREQPGDLPAWSTWRYALAGGPAQPTQWHGFSVTRADGEAIYATRGLLGVGALSLYRIDGPEPKLILSGIPHRDVVNWTVSGGRLWVPDRSDPAHPVYVARSTGTGRVLARLAAPDLGGRASGVTIDPATRAPVYVATPAAVPHLLMLTLGRR